MNQRFKLAAITVAMAIAASGCQDSSKIDLADMEPVVSIREIGPYEPPVPEKSIVITLVMTDDHPLEFAVYGGKELDPAARIEADSKDELKILVASHIDKQAASDPALDTVIIECDGNVKTGDVEAVRAGVALAEVAESWNVFVSVREETNKAIDQEQH